jgi:transcriptional regulator with PAS, ATPase and Fis domain
VCGNVRELKSMVKKAVVLSETDLLDARAMRDLIGTGTKVMADPVPEKKAKRSLSDELNEVERKTLQDAVLVCRSTREMAKYLGISQAGVIRRLKKYKLSLSTAHH